MMKSLYAIPALLLLALACQTSPAQAQGIAIVETMLPGADTGAPLTSIAAQAAKAAPETKPPRYVFPLRLIGAQMTDRQRLQAALRGAPPHSPLQSGRAPPTLPQVNTGGPLVNIEGVPADGTGAPPDPNGAVGETQYVQWVNTRMAIYDKKDGALLLGPIPGNTVFSGFTGSPGADACRLSNNGDPIVNYDQLAKRWLLTQFAWAPGNDFTGPNYQCIAVSTSPMRGRHVQIEKKWTASFHSAACAEKQLIMSILSHKKVDLGVMSCPFFDVDF